MPRFNWPRWAKRLGPITLNGRGVRATSTTVRVRRWFSWNSRTGEVRFLPGPGSWTLFKIGGRRRTRDGAR